MMESSAPGHSRALATCEVGGSCSQARASPVTAASCQPRGRSHEGAVRALKEATLPLGRPGLTAVSAALGAVFWRF